VCGKLYLTPVDLNTHVTLRHPIQPPAVQPPVMGLGGGAFMCHTCGKPYQTQDDLNTHNAMRHPAPAAATQQVQRMSVGPMQPSAPTMSIAGGTAALPFLCQVCGKTYGSQEDLNMHVNARHPPAVQQQQQQVVPQAYMPQQVMYAPQAPYYPQQVAYPVYR